MNRIVKTDISSCDGKRSTQAPCARRSPGANWRGRGSPFKIRCDEVNWTPSGNLGGGICAPKLLHLCKSGQNKMMRPVEIRPPDSGSAGAPRGAGEGLPLALRGLPRGRLLRTDVASAGPHIAPGGGALRRGMARRTRNAPYMAGNDSHFLLFHLFTRVHCFMKGGTVEIQVGQYVPALQPTSRPAATSVDPQSRRRPTPGCAAGVRHPGALPSPGMAPRHVASADTAPTNENWDYG